MKRIQWEQVEITSLDRRGFWLRRQDEELYLPFALDRIRNPMAAAQCGGGLDC